MEIIYPDEFLKSLNQNKDIDSLTDIDINDETYDYDFREDYNNPSDYYEYDDYNNDDEYDFDESYNYLSDYDYSDYNYLSEYDYRDSQEPKQADDENKAIKFAQIKIPYLDISRLRPPFPPFSPWQGPWWPWNYPWSSHFPWNYPWSMHKKNCCDSHGHCHCGPKHPREEDETHINQRSSDYYNEYDNYNYDINDYNNDYDLLEDERGPVPSHGTPPYGAPKPPTAPPPSKLPLKNNKNVKIIDYDGTHKCPPPKPSHQGGPTSGPGYSGENPCKYVPPSYIRNCVGNLVYVWEINGRGYWAYLNKFERGFLTGWKWMGRRWIRFNQHVKRVDAILCYKNN